MNEEQQILLLALEAHDYDEWYSAILHSALEETKDAERAVQVADDVYEQHPTDPSSEKDDDPDALFAETPSNNPEVDSAE